MAIDFLAAEIGNRESAMGSRLPVFAISLKSRLWPS